MDALRPGVTLGVDERLPAVADGAIRFDLRRNGFISTKTWEIWVDGIRGLCERPAFKDALSNIPADELPSLRDLLETGTDPLDMNWIQKWWTGIGFVGRKNAPSTRRTRAQAIDRSVATRPADQMEPTH